MGINFHTIRLFLKHHLTEQPTNYPEQDKELGIVPLKFSLSDFYTQLSAFSKEFSITTVSEISYKADVLPIFEIDINPGSHRKLFILSGTHGNEQASMVCIIDLLRDIKTNPEFYSGIHIKILVPHNPVGAKYFSRYNGNGIDINRDFKRQKAKETHPVIDSLLTFQPDFVMSLHEGPQDEGAFIYCNGCVSTQFAEHILKYASKNGVKLARRNYFTTKLKIPGYFSITGFVYALTKLSSDFLNLQTVDYYARMNKLPCITIETSWRNNQYKERLNGQLQIIKGTIYNLQIFAAIG